jgi:predicted nucleotidyltransferase
MLKPEYKETIIKIIKKHLPKCRIYLFGSRARGTGSPGSDIDLAIDALKKIDRHLICKIKEEIEETNIPFFIDIIDMHQADEKIKSQINKDRLLWSN